MSQMPPGVPPAVPSGPTPSVGPPGPPAVPIPPPGAHQVTSGARRRGRPVLGAVSGFLFGLFVALDLLLLGVVALSSPMIVVLPVVGLVVGAGLGWWAPLRR